MEPVDGNPVGPRRDLGIGRGFAAMVYLAQFLFLYRAIGFSTFLMEAGGEEFFGETVTWGFCVFVLIPSTAYPPAAQWMRGAVRMSKVNRRLYWVGAVPPSVVIA